LRLDTYLGVCPAAEIVLGDLHPFVVIILHLVRRAEFVFLESPVYFNESIGEALQWACRLLRLCADLFQVRSLHEEAD
jgi:hypothetical protein